MTPKGGHLGWVAGVDAPRGAPWTDSIVMDYLEHLERVALKGITSCNHSVIVGQCTEGLHSLKV